MQNSLILLSLLFHKAENMGRSEVLQKILLFALASKRVGRARKTFDQLGVASVKTFSVSNIKIQNFR